MSKWLLALIFTLFLLGVYMVGIGLTRGPFLMPLACKGGEIGFIILGQMRGESEDRLYAVLSRKSVVFEPEDLVCRVDTDQRVLVMP